MFITLNVIHNEGPPRPSRFAVAAIVMYGPLTTDEGGGSAVVTCNDDYLHVTETTDEIDALITVSWTCRPSTSPQS